MLNYFENNYSLAIVFNDLIENVLLLWLFLVRIMVFRMPNFAIIISAYYYIERMKNYIDLHKNMFVVYIYASFVL